MLLFGSKKVIGLDIGASTIKVAELDVSRSGVTLNSFAMSPTPNHSVVSGDILDPVTIATTVAALAQELKTKRKMVSTGLWGSSVIVKKISVPRMDEKVVGEQIRWEAEQYIPFDINEVNLAFKILKNLPQSSETMDILIVAARQEQAMKYVEIIETAGLQCGVLDVGGFALANCFEQNYGPMPGQVVALLNVGASVTNLVILENGEIVFCRDIPVGGLTYTGEIQKGMSISIEEAESMKLSACSGQAAPEEAMNILKNTHEMVSDEIQGSFDFFMNTNSSAATTRCFVTGGSARVPGLMEQLGSVIKLTCEPFDPFYSIKYNTKSFTPAFISDIKDFAAVSVGLGLRKLGDG